MAPVEEQESVKIVKVLVSSEDEFPEESSKQNAPEEAYVDPIGYAKTRSEDNADAIGYAETKSEDNPEVISTTSQSIPYRDRVNKSGTLTAPSTVTEKTEKEKPEEQVMRDRRRSAELATKAIAAAKMERSELSEKPYQERSNRADQTNLRYQKRNNAAMPPKKEGRPSGSHGTATLRDEDIVTATVTKPSADSSIGVNFRRRSTGVVYISRVKEYSPAEKAGIVVGAEVLTINNVHCTGMQLSAVAELVRRSWGSSLNIRYRAPEASLPNERPIHSATVKKTNKSDSVGISIKRRNGSMIVTRVAPDSLLEATDIHEGCEVEEINGKSMSRMSAKSAADLIQNSEDIVAIRYREPPKAVAQELRKSVAAREEEHVQVETVLDNAVSEVPYRERLQHS